MNIMFWIWLAVIAITIVIEMLTTELISIWFAFGAVLPFILSASTKMGFEWQLLIFVIMSAVLILCFRKITKKFLLRNTFGKTNLDALIGERFRMLRRTDFDTIGSVKVKDVEWGAVGDKSQNIDKGEIVEVVGISGNKLVVRPVVIEKQENILKENKK